MWTAVVLGSLATLSFGLIDCSGKQQFLAQNQVTTFTLSDLPYAYDFIAPVLSAKQVYLHHDKHHQRYVDNLNACVQADPAKAGQTLLQLFTNYPACPCVQRHAGGHYNHHMYWWTLTAPQCSGSPQGPLALAINAKWGSFAGFKAAFDAEAKANFGSGWTWLCANATDATLLVTSTADQVNPLMKGQSTECLPVLTLDQWEHAYYVQYLYKREDYTDHWWRAVDWNVVSYFYANFALRGQAVPF